MCSASSFGKVPRMYFFSARQQLYSSLPADPEPDGPCAQQTPREAATSLTPHLDMAAANVMVNVLVN